METDQMAKTHCGICIEDFYTNNLSETFETLLCGHKICNSCFENLVKFNKNNCPFCRKPFFPIKKSKSNWLDFNQISDNYNSLNENFYILHENYENKSSYKHRKKRKNNESKNDKEEIRHLSAPEPSTEPIFIFEPDDLNSF